MNYMYMLHVVQLAWEIYRGGGEREKMGEKIKGGRGRQWKGEGR